MTEEAIRLEEAPSPVVVPDGVEPIIGYRCWKYDGEGKELRPLVHGCGVWKPGVPIAAGCPSIGQTTWRQGFTRELTDPSRGPTEYAYEHGQGRERLMPLTLKTAPPPGFHPNWISERVPWHQSPHEDCSCGVYAVAEPARIPWEYGGGQRPYNFIWGSVKLWGKVIAGEYGWRAEYAYPGTLCTASEEVAEALAAYGVPVFVSEYEARGQRVEIERVGGSRRKEQDPSSLLNPDEQEGWTVMTGEPVVLRRRMELARRRMVRVAWLNGVLALTNFALLLWRLLA